MKKILIADDAVSVVKLEEVLLRRTGCTIITATDGTEALKKIQSERPQVALIDYAMPGMTGDTICRFVKSHPELSSTRVIIITAKSDPDTEERCRRAGCDEFIRKPFHFRELLNIVTRYI